MRQEACLFASTIRTARRKRTIGGVRLRKREAGGFFFASFRTQKQTGILHKSSKYKGIIFALQGGKGIKTAPPSADMPRMK